MFLKSLEIFGFKSFANKTKIEFSEGITALLGPNGCGKSNVVDAIKWVLGEQAAKNMRAEKMEDVIFNGTDKRKPLNVAEVTLTIVNEQGLLPIDYNEVAIKRRLYRSGESEYYINGNLSKLKDVRELFWDTGVGKAAYSVMEQGKIDQILSSKPQDRRYLFEEAAGITRFKVKREEAERKLERTEENMRQVDGILAEVKKSYDSLKVQAEKTNKYRALKQEVFNNELDIQLLRLKSFSDDKARKKSDLDNLDKKRRDLKEEITKITETVTSHLDAVKTMTEEKTEILLQAASLQVQANAKSEQAKQLSLRKSESKNKVAQLEGRKSGIEDRIEDLREEIDESESSLHSLNRKLVDISKSIEEFKQNIELASKQITDNEVSCQNIQKSIEELNELRLGLQSELDAITEDIVTELDSKLKDAGYSSSSRRSSEEKLLHTLSQLKIIVSGKKDLFSDFSKIGSDVKSAGENAVSAFDEIDKLLSQFASDFDEYKNSIPDFIDEFLSPEGIITKKRDIDSKIKDNLDKVEKNQDRIRELQGENGNLSEKIEGYREALDKLKLSEVQMNSQIETKQNSISFLKRDLATQEGILRDLENDLYAENKNLSEISGQIVDLESEIASLEHQGKNLNKRLDELEAEINSKNKDASGKQSSIQKKTEELAHIQAQFERVDREIETSDIEIRNIKENFRESQGLDIMEFESRMFDIKASPADLRTKLATARQQIKDLGSVNFMAIEEFAEAKERYEFLSNQLADLQKGRDDLKRITEEIRAESTELFLSTYNKIKKNFFIMFRKLFNGGNAELRLTDPQNVLESGVEIFARPPGKKLENISLLSGGEKTMTAVALMFATYQVRPSPFCLLDEIDAALDGPNVARFVNALKGFANVSQYIVITHNTKTATSAPTMLGVTMEDSGISKLVQIHVDTKKGTLDNPPEEEFVEDDFDEEVDSLPEEEFYIPPHPIRRKVSAVKPSEENKEEQKENG